ncbi:MAG: acyl-ACP--UDP-N-acetylglucosamine O-acyltransferase [Phycisphaerales bacterium]|nr:acyl-ACP--UDP-N-acetylglucosamine O-acyltransferase [Phycisphaerales bacterium]
MPQIHPQAFVDPSAELDDSVVVESGAYIGPRCRVGARTVLKRGAQVVQDTTLGSDNVLYPNCVIGGDPQDKGYKAENPGVLIVGDRNVFRENVTIGRSSEYGHGLGKPTRIGSGCFFMTCSHVGHNSVVEDNVVLTNGSAIGGHCRIGANCNLSGFTHVHQFCRLGEFVMIRGSAGVSMHVPPFVIVDTVNSVGGLNRIGIRRSGRFSADDQSQIKEMFRIIYRTGGLLEDRIAHADSSATLPGARMFVDFVRATTLDQPPFRRGMVGPRWRRADKHPAALEIME